MTCSMQGHTPHRGLGSPGSSFKGISMLRFGFAGVLAQGYAAYFRVYLG